ncbi:HD domain-containing protein [Nocardia sp. NBC_00565]|uniref:HD domain-containing protein n=1 Tax=Nocardia sp. NBC_00565 TaxID=2975993 RepID=UPI002E811F77|nr:HD domain-containing protein [Nocardia sp. NBC_00565]WUC03571.1 HD domain-containing protein [Nocardia sp. NBC_00565]
MTTDANARSEFSVPTTELAVAADELARSVSPEFIYNHAMRGYLFGREVAAAMGMRAGVDYDDELVFLASILHDLGATEHANGNQRFEVDGADAAAEFLTSLGLDQDRVKLVWNAIALHTSDGLCHRFGPTEAVTQMGIGVDIIGRFRDKLSPEFADRVHAAYPRYNLGYALSETIANQVHANPAKMASPMSFPAHVYQLQYPDHAARVTWHDILDASGWADKPIAR